MAGRTQIGALSILLSANSQAFDKTMDQAGRKMQSFAKLASSPISMGGSILSAPGRVLSQGLAPIQNAISSIPGIGSALGGLATPSGFFEAFKEEAKELVTTERNANSLGLRMGQLIAIQRAAGPAAEHVVPALRFLERELGAVSMGSAEAAKRFENMGFNAQKLVAMGPAKAFEEIAKKVTATLDPFEKNKSAFDALGKKGQELIPTLAKVADGLGALENKSIAQGLVPTGQQMDQLKQFLVAQRQMDSSVAGLRRQAILTGAGPVSSFANNMAEKPGTTAGKVGFWTGAGAIAGGVIGAIIVPGAGAVPGAAIGGALGSAAGFLAGAGGGVKNNAAQARAEIEAEERERESAAARALAAAEDDLIDKLRMQIETFGMSAGKLMEFNVKLAGMSDATAHAAGLLTEYHDALVKGKSLSDAMLSPLESFNRKITEYEKLLDLGAISQATFERATAAAGEAIEKAYPPGELSGPMSGLEAGSQADRSFGLQLQREQADKKDSGKLLEEAFQRARDRDLKRDSLLREIVDAVRNERDYNDSLDDY